MSAINDWINSTAELAKDNQVLQDKILELKEIDKGYDDVLLASEKAQNTIKEQSEQINSLKDRCWALFEKQTAADAVAQPAVTKQQPEVTFLKPEQLISK